MHILKYSYNNKGQRSLALSLYHIRQWQHYREVARGGRFATPILGS